MRVKSDNFFTFARVPMSTLAEKGLQISKSAFFKVFIGRATKLLGKPFKVIAILNETADKLASKDSKDNKFKQLFGMASMLVRLVRNYISGDYRDVATGTIISGFAVLLYVLSPIDLVPDFIPVLGFLDDLSLISWFLGKFQGEMTRYRTWEDSRHSQVATSSTPDFTARPATGDMQQPLIAELGHS